MSGRQIMTADEIRRATIRLSHEIVEKQAGTDGLLLIGIQRRGVPLARRIAAPSPSTRARRSRSGRSTSRSTATTSRSSPSSPSSRAPNCRRASTVGRSSSSTTSSTPDARSAPRWTRSSTSVVRRRSASPCSSIAAIASCRSAPTTSARTCRRRARSSSRSTSRRPTARTSSRSSACRVGDARAGGRARRVSLVVDPDAVVAGPLGRRRPGDPAGRLAASPPARRRRPVGRGPRPRDAHDRRDARGPGPADRQGPGAARPAGHDPLLRGLDADPRQLRGRGQEPLGRRRQHRGGLLVGDEGRVARRHGPDRRGARRRTCWSCATASAARRTSRPRSSAGPCSTAATAGTRTRRRRSSTCTRCASHLGDASLAGRKVVILGDILHSRVARSNIWTLTAAGADLWLCGPATLLRGLRGLGRPRRGRGTSVPRDDVDRRGAARRRRRHGPAHPARADGVGPAAVAARVRGTVRADRRAPASGASPRRSSCIPVR